MNQNGQLRQVLLKLGSTAEEVATTLKTHKVQGVRNTLRHLNPIVRFVERHLRIDDYALCLAPSENVAALRMSLPNGSSEEILLPKAVHDFLDAFNRGEHPAIELAP